MSDFTLNAGKLREKVRIEAPLFGGASALGDMAENWTPIAKNVPAWIDWLSGQKLLAARAVHAEASASVTIRYNPKLTPQCRFIDEEGRMLRIVSFAPDPKKRHISMLCKSVLPASKG